MANQNHVDHECQGAENALEPWLRLEARSTREIGSTVRNDGNTQIVAPAVTERLTFQATHHVGER
jgi:hypothetical protein